MSAEPAIETFEQLQLSEPLLRALAGLGYEAPSPIQASTIPPLLAGQDVLGQAQTGTGKTAAFALPILARLQPQQASLQALVLTPTRELALQVAETFQSYAKHLEGFQILPIYGGQAYGPQLHGLRRGAQVVVGTPGRVIDHLRRGSLDLSALRFLVLDEADEMLRMGFIDDVDTILKETPATRQTALFSATMPGPIRRIAQTHMRDPVEVTIASKTTTATNIRQRYWAVSGVHKLDALTRILEAEPYEAMLIFTRTRRGTEELAEKLQARGLAAAAVHGDIVQAQRERVVQQLKDGKLDILVATDVAARGLDVQRISHVLNYDIPYDTESYVHRIGRTGRAGRSGEAILFVTPRERGMLRAIERATRQPIQPMQLPSIEAVNEQRVARFKQRITDTLEERDMSVFRSLVEDYEREHDVPAVDIAAALARLLQGETPLLLDPPARRERSQEPRQRDANRPPRESFSERRDTGPRDAGRPAPPRPPRPMRAHVPEPGKQTYRLEVGHVHGVGPGNIIGAIANEAGLDSKFIGRLSIGHEHSLIDLPEGMPVELLRHLKKVWVAGQRLRITPWHGTHESGAGADADGGRTPPRKPRPQRAPRQDKDQ